MSYRLVAAAIKGDQLAALPDVMNTVGLEGYGAPQKAAAWSDVADEVFDGSASKTAPVAACVAGAWTLLLSEVIALAAFEGDEALTSLAQSRGWSLFSVVADSTTGMYGYRLAEPVGTRFVFVEGGRADESGPALECEGLIAADGYSEENLLDVMDHLDLDFEQSLEEASPVLIWRHG